MSVSAASSIAPIVPSTTPTAHVGWGRRSWRGLVSATDWAFGFAALVVGLAILSVIPVLNFLSLGYLLEAGARVARSGRFRDGFIGVRKAAVLGSIVIGVVLVSLPLQLLVSYWHDAELIAPGGRVARGWQIAAIFLMILTCAYVAWALVRGGRLRHFLWPAPLRGIHWLRSPGKYRQMRDGAIDYVISLKLPHYFWLGLRGFVGGLVWLALPVGILIGASHVANDGGALILSLLGGGLLIGVTMYLSFLQVRFAQTDRFLAMFEVREVRSRFRRAPLLFWLSLTASLVFALPLYLAKIELAPRELAWLPSLFFVLFILPARALTGWALYRAERREHPRHGFWRWTSRLGGIPVLFGYAFFVYLMQYLSWHGSWGMLEQHAFLLPAPMWTM